MNFAKFFSLLLLLLLAAAVPAARADDPAPPAQRVTSSVSELVEHQLDPGARDQFLAEAARQGVNFSAIADVEVTSDAQTGEVLVTGNPLRHKRAEMIFVGAQLGLLLPFGVTGTAMFTRDDKPEWDLDASWEPSNMLQSYSLGGAYHPFHNIVFVGARLRYLQLHAPWSRGFDGAFDNQFGMGAELGIRGWLDQGQTWLGTLSVGAMYVPSSNIDLPVLFTLNVGLAYRAFRHEDAR